MSEPALKIVETEVTEKAVSLVEQAGMVKIENAKSYEVAGFLWKTIGEVMKEVDETFDPIISASHKAWKQALAQKAKYYDPLDKAKRGIKNLMSFWDAEEESKRLAEQKRLEEIAKKEEEERRLLEAIEAEEAGEKEESEAILQEPVYIPPVVLPKETPKVKGLSFREVWSAEIISTKELCRGVAEGNVSPECVMGNMPVLNKMAMALKQTMNVRGVRAVSKRV